MNKYIFRVSAVVDNNFVVTAKDYDEARAMRDLIVESIKHQLMDAVNGKTESGWDYDGNINDEGDEDMGCDWNAEASHE